MIFFNLFTEGDKIQKLIKNFQSIIPDDYQIVVNHMTINLGEINPIYEKYLGISVRLQVNDIAMDDKVIALGVSGFESDKKKPHITLAVNREAGGKPYMSDNLTEWKPLKKPIFLSGKVEEIGFHE